jgi:hypothetical protein
VDLPANVVLPHAVVLDGLLRDLGIDSWCHIDLCSCKSASHDKSEAP